MSKIAELQKEMRAREGMEKITFTRGGSAITYHRKQDIMEDGFRRGIVKVTSKAEIYDEEDALYLPAFDYAKTNGNRQQKEIMEVFADYWACFAEEKQLNSIHMDVVTEVFSKKGHRWKYARGILAAIRLGYDFGTLPMTIKPECVRTIYIEVDNYRCHDKKIETIVNAIEGMRKSDGSVNFTDTLQRMKDETAPLLFLDGQIEAPFYSGRILWEGFVGHIGFYADGQKTKIRIFEEAEKQTFSYEFRQVKEFLVQNEDLEIGLNRVFESIQDYMGMENALRVPSVSFEELVRRMLGFHDVRDVTDQLMDQLGATGLTYRDVESEAVRVLGNANIKSGVKTNFMRTQGIYFELLGRMLCIGYRTGSHKERYKQQFKTKVTAEEAEVIEFFQGIVKEEMEIQFKTA